MSVDGSQYNEQGRQYKDRYSCQGAVHSTMNKADNTRTEIYVSGRLIGKRTRETIQRQRFMSVDGS